MRKTIATVGKCGRMGGRLRHAAAWAAVALLLWTLCAPRMAMAEVTPTGAVAPSPDGQVTPLPGGEGDVEEAATSTDSPAPTGTASPQSSPAPTETLRRADNPLITPLRYQPLPTDGQAAFKDTLNILLLGFDAEYKFYAQDGGDSHTDAMMLLSVNTKTNAITLISLPRDTLTYVPGVRGIYKLNGAINAGGGKTAAGFRCAVEAASVLLGNIPIDYYIGLDMEKVAELGDLLGGVDVEVTIAFTTESGRRITPGMKHLDGEAMYSYMRARKSAEGTDKGRTKRQRAVISAMLQKVKGEQLYLRIPQMMAAMQDGVYTDMTAEALLRLLPAAMHADTDEIGLYTVEGTLRAALNGWNMLFVDQDARRELLRTVFGIDASPMPYASFAYTQWLVGDGKTSDGAFGAIRALYVAERALGFAAGVADQNGTLTESRKAVAERIARVQTQFCDTADAVMQASGAWGENPDAVSRNKALCEAVAQLQTDVTVMVGLCGFPGDSGLDALGRGDMRWTYKTRWETDGAINSVYVNFH